MRKSQLIGSTTLVGLLAVPPAFAADLAPVKYRESQNLLWSGFYVGANGGFAWSADPRVDCLGVGGPCATTFPAPTAKGAEFGLQAGVFTRDFKRITRAFETLEVGGLMIGEVPTFRIDHMPYGGTKDSGLGREGLRYAIEEMTEPRLLAINPAGL